MGGISWVSGLTGSQGSGLSMIVAMPSGLANGDGLFALVMAASAVTAPAGWTLVDSSAATGSGTTQTLYLYRKDTVTSANSGVAQTWQQASSLMMAVTYFAVRADSGVVVMHQWQETALSNTTCGTGEAIPTASASFSEMICVTVATTILQAGGSANPTPPIGTSKFTALSTSNYRMAASYAAMVEGDVITGTWTMVADTALNGMNLVTILLRDQEEQTTITDTVVMTPVEDTGGSTYGIVAQETLGLRALLGILYQDGLAETLGLADSIASILPQRVEVAEEVELLAPLLYAWAGLATETLGLSATEFSSPGVVLREGLGIDDLAICNQKLGLAVVEALATAADILAGRPLTVTESLALAEMMAAAHVVTIVQELGLAATVLPIATYHLTVSQGLGLATSLANFFGGDVLEALGLQANESHQALLREQLEDGIGLEAEITPSFILKATASDGLEFSSDELLQQIFSGQIVEGLELSGAYIGPDGSFTTWAMNTRTGAVSEYDNYQFNSFARVGNKYLGATASGLYQLTGDDDAGDAVVARLKGGFLQFGGTHLSRIKAAYLAMTGEGTAVLRIETKDGALYNYSVPTRDGRSTKVHMGKGQRSRYFAWELVTAGQDFDLDTLEFVPLVVQRRV